MQYSWAITCVALLFIGICAAGIATRRKGANSPLGRNIHISTTVAILAVFLHNIIWEREITEVTSKGWTLIYTFPVFLICVSVSGILAVTFAIRFRRYRSQVGDPQAAPREKQTYQGGGH